MVSYNIFITCFLLISSGYQALCETCSTTKVNYGFTNFQYDDGAGILLVEFEFGNDEQQTNYGIEPRVVVNNTVFIPSFVLLPNGTIRFNVSVDMQRTYYFSVNGINLIIALELISHFSEVQVSLKMELLLF